MSQAVVYLISKNVNRRILPKMEFIRADGMPTGNGALGEVPSSGTSLSAARSED